MITAQRSYGLRKIRSIIAEANKSNNSKIGKQLIAVQHSYSLTKTRSVFMDGAQVVRTSIYEGKATYISLEATNIVEADVIIEKEDVLGTANMAVEVVATVDTATAKEEDDLINAPDEVV